MPDPTITATGARIYGPFDRPEVWVRHADGDWYAGRLHAWVPSVGAWRAVVSYHVDVGLQHYLDVADDEVEPREGEVPDGYRRPSAPA